MTDAIETNNGKGFTGGEATARLRDKAGKAQITFLSLAIMAKMKGKTNKAIRNDLGDNCPTWISKIFTMADKAMAHIPLARQADVSAMTVAQAESAVVSTLEAHMTALGVTGFEKYGKVCHFPEKCEASENVLNPPADVPAPAAEPETPAAPAANSNDAISEPVTQVDGIVRVAETLGDAELADLMAKLNAIAIARAEIAALIEAQDERKAA